MHAEYKSLNYKVKKKTISIFKLTFQDNSQTNLKQDQTRYAKFSCPLVYLVPVFAVKCKTKLKPKHEKIGQLGAWSAVVQVGVYVISIKFAKQSMPVRVFF